MHPGYSLQVDELHQQYQQQPVLNGINLQLKRGELVAVLGPNAAGKTSLIRSILGLVATQRGDIRLFGELQQGARRSVAMRQRLGVMLQVGSASANLTVREQCDLFSSYYPQAKTVAELLDIAGLQAQANTRFGRLSGGQKQRLLFALALAGNPQLVFLDEPTLGMDVEARHALWQQIRNLKAQGVSIVLTTHYLEEAEQLAEQIAVLQQGRIIACDSPQALTARLDSRQVSCITTLSMQQLQNLPGVLQVLQQQQRIQLICRRPEETVRALLNADPQLSALEIKAAALEQVFLQLTTTGAAA
jgi:ABC-2 type transport system ATP-binding protein